MKIIAALPPNAKAIKERFGEQKGVCYTYGSTIYSPETTDLPEDIVIHEEVHAKSQGMYPAAWWESYMRDSEFRLSEELAAYSVQAKWIKDRVPAKVYKEALFELANNLKEIYHIDIDHAKAESLIRHGVRDLSNEK